MSATLLAGILVAIGGAVAGALFAEIRLWLQLRREAVTQLRRVLYVQLDLWHGVLRSDPEEIVASIAPIIARHFGVAVAEAERSLDAAGPLRTFVAAAVAMTVPPDLETRYTEAVHALGGIDPLRAFQLNNRPAITRYRTSVGELFEQSGLAAAAPRELALVTPEVQRTLRSNVLDLLEADMRDVGLAISVRTWWRLRRTLRRDVPDFSAGELRRLDALISRMLAALPDATPAAAAASAPAAMITVTS